jgi:hypothetical protein
MFLLDSSYWQIKNHPKKGKGVFARRKIPAGRVIGDYLGMVLKTEEYDLESDARGLYLLYLTDETAVYPDLTRPGIHLFNHACRPNCWMYVHEGHTLFFAITDIEVGGELTIHYLLSPKENGCPDCTHDCYCEGEYCTGTMHLPPERFAQWQAFQDAQRATQPSFCPIVGKPLPLLDVYPDTLPIASIYQEIVSQTMPAVSS